MGQGTGLEFFKVNMDWQTVVKENRLAVREVRLSEITNNLRIEAEFYTAQTTSVGLVRGGDVVSFSQYGTSKGLNENSLGYPVLRLNEFELSFSGRPAKYCDLLSEAEFVSLKLKKGDVLICRTNGNPEYVGKSALVMEDADYAFASYLFRLNTNDKIGPATLVAYLNSRIGREEVGKYSIVSNQANFSPAKFREITIPLFTKAFESQVEGIFLKSWTAYKEAKIKYLEAETAFLSEIGLRGYSSTSSNISVRSLKQCSKEDRFDAEYWQPKYDKMANKVSSVSQKELGEIASAKKGVETGSEAYEEEGKSFVRVSDFSIYGIDEGEKKISEELYETLKENYKPHKGEVLFTKDGTIGISFALHDDIEAIVSSAFLRLKPKIKINSDYLALVLNSVYCKAQIERMSGGAIIAHLKPDSAMKIKIPMLSDKKQEELARKVSDALRLRKEAKALLEKAERAVEIFIEQDEKSALAYLSK